jgi:hypothetical protein
VIKPESGRDITEVTEAVPSPDLDGMGFPGHGLAVNRKPRCRSSTLAISAIPTDGEAGASCVNFTQHSRSDNTSRLV